MSRPSPPVLSVERLAKSFGELRAVDAISFLVSPGEIVGLVGPNGAGKTTTINMILGVLEPSGGRIEIEGVDLRADRSRALSRRRADRDRGRRSSRRPQQSALQHQLRRSLRAVAQQSHG
jgi:ABC-type branched-subunit amino acid transport system ATPase component